MATLCSYCELANPYSLGEFPRLESQKFLWTLLAPVFGKGHQKARFTFFFLTS